MPKRGIKLLCMDVDGTLTDGSIYLGETGEVLKAFNVRDGFGIAHVLPAAGIEPLVITGRTSRIVEVRCKELDVKALYQGEGDKASKLEGVCARRKLAFNEIAYIGDDVNDLESMKMIKQAGGLVGCPADAATEVRDVADFISPEQGGHGAVRSFIDWLVSGAPPDLCAKGRAFIS